MTRAKLSQLDPFLQEPVPIIMIFRDVAVMQGKVSVPAATLHSDTLIQGWVHEMAALEPNILKIMRCLPVSVQALAQVPDLWHGFDI